MALITYSNLEEVTYSTGIGNMVLSGPGRGGQGLYSRCSDGDTFRYYISGVDSSGKPDGEWEQGLGTWRTGNIVERTSIDSSSNSDAKVSFSAGPKYLKVLNSVNEGLSSTQVTAVQALVSWAGNRTVVADAAYAGAAPANATAHLQALIDAASAAYSPDLGRVRVVVPAGVWTVDQILWRGNVWYDFTGAMFRQSLTQASPGRAMFTCARVLVGGTTYYGNHQNIKITGGQVESNGHVGGTNIVQMFEFEDADISDFTVVHSAGRANWAWFVCGHRIKVLNPTVLGGTVPYQDGLHIGYGRDITVTGGYIESGDDAVVCGYDTTDVSQAYDDEGLENVSWMGTVVRSARGFGVSLYYGRDTYGFGGSYRRRLSNIKVAGIVGTAGKYRNGAIRVYDNTVGGPGTNNTVIKNCTIDAALTCGDSTHDGVNAFGIHINTGSQIKINAALTITDTTGAAVRFRPIYCLACDGLEISLKQSGLTELSSRFGPSSAAHTVRDWKIVDSDLSAANVDGGHCIDLNNNIGGTMTRGEIRGSVLRNIRNTSYGVLAQGSTTVGTLKINGNTFLKASGATTQVGYQGSTLTAVSHIEMVGNDFSDMSAGSPGSQFAANHASFFVRNNRGFTSQVGGTAVITAAATSIVVTPGNGVRMTDTTSASGSQISVVLNNVTTNAIKWTVAPTATTTFTISSDVAPGASTAIFSWRLDTSQKPV